MTEAARLDPFHRISFDSRARRIFGARIRLRRYELDMDERALAEQAACLPHQVTDAELGDCYLPGVLRRMAEVLGISVGRAEA